MKLTASIQLHFVCIIVYTCVHCTHALTHMHAHTHTHTHTHTLTLTHSLMHSLTHTHTLSLSLSHTHTHSLSLSPSLSHTHSLTLSLSLSLSLSHTHTHTHTHTLSLSPSLSHTHTHTHTHTLSLSLSLSLSLTHIHTLTHRKKKTVMLLGEQLLGPHMIHDANVSLWKHCHKKGQVLLGRRIFWWSRRAELMVKGSLLKMFNVYGLFIDMHALSVSWTWGGWSRVTSILYAACMNRCRQCLILMWFDYRSLWSRHNHCKHPRVPRNSGRSCHP